MKVKTSQRLVFQAIEDNAILESSKKEEEVIKILREEGRSDSHIDQLIQQISTSELTINFFPEYKFSLSRNRKSLEVVYLLRKAKYFLNQWEILRDLGSSAVENYDYLRKRQFIEDECLGYVPFKNAFEPTAEEAVSRPRYASLNLFKELGGATHYGDVALILPPAVLECSTVTCRDSYKYYQNLMVQRGMSPSYATFPSNREYQPIPGTFSNLYHQLYKFYLDSLYQQKMKPARTSRDIIDWRDWCDQVLRAGQGYAPDRSFNYWEAQIHGTIEFPVDILGLQSHFRYLGTPTGDCLRQWARDWGWFLTWTNFDALGPKKMFLDPLTSPAIDNKLGPRKEGDQFRDLYLQELRKKTGDKKLVFNTLWEKSPPFLRYELRDLDREIGTQLQALSRGMTVPADNH